ncbi:MULTISPECIES: 1-phosphofructokinase [unclassified Bacillus (in: firmicutes)]|uniref:1-phosphofructokinase n=1 Tax=unclassified Bacillus (in: firmicutes) TaxID=185979 RepID=UPI0008EA657F|nr:MULTISPECIES: 1-phosphofructokinase [unclassified Bacillus (in: firmicutes)]SFA91686.1 fructose-1-phosphate kinase [Bacillus sp. UNCCL13]SFQ85633.1 fructose-1-phosphate kinase [Bacillus sp. cl95]
MIYTLTLNPSVDYVVILEEVKVGELNRTSSEVKFPGGKGINVSRVLSRVGVDNKALGFLGGFTGDYIENQLISEGVQSEFVRVKEDTRINIKIKSKNETEINATGPKIQDDQLEALKEQITKLTNLDVLVMSGSIPSTITQSIYLEFAQICRQNGTAFVVDVGGDLLDAVLPFEPFLIKPNHHELGDLFGVEISSVQQVIPLGKNLLERGAQNIIISMADKGAVFMNNEKTLLSSVAKGSVVSSVGAGDSMVGAFLAASYTEREIEEAFRFSVAAGSATAFSLDLCTKEKIEEILPQLVISEI